MPVVTLTGRSGGPLRAVGVETARLLGADFVDNPLLVEAARRAGVPVAQVEGRDERVERGRERAARFFRVFLERSAAAGAAGDPFLGPTGIEVLLSRGMAEAGEPAADAADQLNDARLIKVVTAVIEDQAAHGNVVILGRGSNVILRDWPGALHVWLVAGLPGRVQEIARRERLTPEEAEKFIKRYDEGRAKYYRKFHHVAVDDSNLYHLFLNTDRLGVERTAAIMAETAKDMDPRAKAI